MSFDTPSRGRLLSAAMIFAMTGLVWLAACSDSDDPVTPSGGGNSNVSGNLGAAGGTLTSSDGKVTLTVPPGALTADTDITVTELKGAEMPDLGPGMTPVRSFAMEPVGLAFTAPATLEFPVEFPAPKIEAKRDLPVAVTVVSGEFLEEDPGATVAEQLRLKVDHQNETYGAVLSVRGLSSTNTLVLINGVVPAAPDPIVSTTQQLDAAPLVGSGLNANVEYAVTDGVSFKTDIKYRDYGNTGITVDWDNLESLPTDYEGTLPEGYYYGYDIPATASTVGATNLALGFEIELDIDYEFLYGQDAVAPIIAGSTVIEHRFADVPVNIQPDDGGGDDWLPSGSYVAFNGLEGVTVIKDHPGFRYGRVALISGDNSTVGYGLKATGAMIKRITKFETPNNPKYGAFTVSYKFEKAAPAGMTFVQFGPNGLLMSSYDNEIDDFGWSQLAFNGQNVTDGQPFDGDSEANGFVLANNTTNLASVFEVNQETGFYDQVGQITSFENSNGSVVTAAVRDGGSALIVADGTPGRIYTHDRNDYFATASYLGDAGDSPRRVRTAAGLAVVSNYGSDNLTVLTWSDMDEIAIAGTVPVGDGPVGIDLYEMNGGDVAVASTGYNDNSYSVTVLSPTGSVVSNTKSDMPAGAEGPGHVVWLGDPDNRLLITCNVSGNVVVLDPGVE